MAGTGDEATTTAPYHRVITPAERDGQRAMAINAILKRKGFTRLDDNTHDVRILSEDGEALLNLASENVTASGRTLPRS
jgi:hypothetical protein